VYLYSPPTRSGPSALPAESLSQRRQQGPVKLNPPPQVGLAVLLSGGVYSVKSQPTAAEVAAADAAYLGGHEHVVTEEIKLALEAAGVGGTFVAIGE